MLNSDGTDTGLPAAEIEPIAQPQQTSVNWLALLTDTWWHVWPHLSLKDKARLLQVRSFFNNTFCVELARNTLQENRIQEVTISYDQFFFIYPNGSVRVCEKTDKLTSTSTLLPHRAKQIVAGRHDTIFVTMDGKLLHFSGSGENLNDRIKQMQDIPGLFPIRQIIPASDRDVLLILSENGRVWKWMIKQGYYSKQQYRQLPELVNAVFDIQQVVADGRNAILINNVGEVWFYDHYYDNVQKILNIPPIKQAVIHMKDIYCLDIHGNVWICKPHDKNHVPSRVPNLTSIRQMVDGYSFGDVWGCIFFIDIDGKVRGLGGNNNRQLGTGDRQYRTEPIIIPNLPPIKEIIVADNCITFFIDINGKVWGCGTNLKDQLGLTNNDFKTPTVIANVPPIKKIVANSDIVAFLDVTDQVWIYVRGSVSTPVLLASSSQKTVIPNLSMGVLAELACSSENYGQLCYEEIIARLRREKNLYRNVHFAIILEHSPWKQETLQIELLESLLKKELSPWSLVVNEDNGNKNIPASAFGIFTALVELYNYVISDIKLLPCQNNFLNLMTRISRREITTENGLKEYCLNLSEASQNEINKIGIFSNLNSKLARHYCELMQKFVNCVARKPEIFEHLPAAALHLQYRKFAAEQRMFASIHVAKTA